MNTSINKSIADSLAAIEALNNSVVKATAYEVITANISSTGKGYMSINTDEATMTIKQLHPSKDIAVATAYKALDEVSSAKGMNGTTLIKLADDVRIITDKKTEFTFNSGELFGVECDALVAKLTDADVTYKVQTKLYDTHVVSRKVVAYISQEFMDNNKEAIRLAKNDAATIRKVSSWTN